MFDLLTRLRFENFHDTLFIVGDVGDETFDGGFAPRVEDLELVSEIGKDSSGGSSTVHCNETDRIGFSSLSAAQFGDSLGLVSTELVPSRQLRFRRVGHDENVVLGHELFREGSRLGRS